MSLLSELKRRNVFRVATAYVVISWLLIQVANTLVPILGLSPNVTKTVLLLLILGFIPALFFSWAYEVTPEGIKKEQDVERDTSIASITAKKLDMITLVGVVGVVGLFIYQQISPYSTQYTYTDTPLEETNELSQSEAKEQLNVFESGTQNKTTPELVLGVAVLPFDNLSEDPNNAFFAGGVHEDVLTHLTYIKKLRIISRTSMLKVAERGMEVREIGKHLGVSHVLEGSVRRAGEQVRVTVQLIDAATDEHIWASNFDRKLDDIFAIQSEIAAEIAGYLKTELNPEEKQQINYVPTTNTEAYDLYLQAREISRVWRGAETFKDMLPLLEKAAALDPNFLDVQVLLVEVYGRLVWTNSDPTGIYKIKAKRSLDAIQKNHPNSLAADEALGQYLYTVEQDYLGSAQVMEKVLAIRPNDAEALSRVASSYKRLSNFEKGLPLIQKAVSVDPEHSSIALELSLHLVGTGLYKQAFQTAKLNSLRFPNDYEHKITIAVIGLRRFGMLSEFKAIINSLDISLEERDQSIANLLFLFINAENIDDLINAYKNSTSYQNPIEKIHIDIRISLALSIVGRKQDSHKYALNALQNYQKNAATINTLINSEKRFYSGLTLLACLADDKTSFKQFQTAMQSHKAKELYDGHYYYPLALAECGDIEKSWHLFFKGSQSNTFGYITQWDLALGPEFQHYFSELPEYQAMVADLEANKEVIE